MPHLTIDFTQVMYTDRVINYKILSENNDKTTIKHNF